MLGQRRGGAGKIGSAAAIAIGTVFVCRMLNNQFVVKCHGRAHTFKKHGLNIQKNTKRMHSMNRQTCMHAHTEGNGAHAQWRGIQRREKGMLLTSNRVTSHLHIETELQGQLHAA